MYCGDVVPETPINQYLDHVASSFVEYLRGFLSRGAGGYGFDLPPG